MIIPVLEENLFSHTNSEEWHLRNPGKLSPRYQAISSVTDKGQSYYCFSFDSVLKNNNISILKESRFTQIPLHVHSVIEINYIYRGNCTQIINGVRYELQKGDLCILDTNTLHEILPLSEEDIVITIDMRKSYFTTGFLSRLSSQGIVASFLASAISRNTEKKQCLIFRHYDDKLQQLVRQLMCEYFDKQIASAEIIDAYMIIIFSELLRLYMNHQEHIKRETDSENNLLKMLQYIELNYATITLKSMAGFFSFHPNYLTAYLKQHTGKTFKELVIIQRMSKACFYLSNSTTPIYEIAQEIGYNNLGFFYEKFRDLYQMTPMEYRESYLKTAQP